MKVYDTGNIRNVVLLGHGGAGKTTVAEALAYVTGTTTRMGSVPEGNTVSDYDKEEIKRKFSISATTVPIEYKGEHGDLKINILDTPGYFDFVGGALVKVRKSELIDAMDRNSPEFKELLEVI